jgi:hypothetical protein
MIDLPDIAVTFGVILICAALYLALGIVAAMAFVGTVLIVLGAAAAWKRGRRTAK